MLLFLLGCLIINVSSTNIQNVTNISTTAGLVRLVIGGALKSDSPILSYYEKKSDVVYMTAAGSDPVGDGKSIGSFFQKRGIKATWIPVYGSNCAQRCSDKQYIDRVKKADAMYFSGGKSGLLSVCLFGGKQSGSTPLLEAIREMSLVGGSSAGAMVQPLKDIMITGSSGGSYESVRDSKVYYRPAGNGIISSGLVDVHFSERGRQGRLLVLAVNTKTKWAFGVDENTAFKVNDDGSGGILVVGNTGGVIIYEGATSMTNAKMHYLTHGDTISQDGKITFAAAKKPCPVDTAPKTSTSIFSGVNFKTVSCGLARYSKKTKIQNYHGSRPAVEVDFDNTQATAACDGKLVSFTNMIVSMTKNSDYVNTEVRDGDMDDQLWMLDI